MKTRTLRKLLLEAEDSVTCPTFCKEAIACAYEADLINKEQAKRLSREFNVELHFI